jgi:hypothetical protein
VAASAAKPSATSCANSSRASPPRVENAASSSAGKPASSATPLRTGPHDRPRRRDSSCRSTAAPSTTTRRRTPSTRRSPASGLTTPDTSARQPPTPSRHRRPAIRRPAPGAHGRLALRPPHPAGGPELQPQPAAPPARRREASVSTIDTHPTPPMPVGHSVLSRIAMSVLLANRRGAAHRRDRHPDRAVVAGPPRLGRRPHRPRPAPAVASPCLRRPRRRRRSVCS